MSILRTIDVIFKKFGVPGPYLLSFHDYEPVHIFFIKSCFIESNRPVYTPLSYQSYPALHAGHYISADYTVPSLRDNYRFEAGFCGEITEHDFEESNQDNEVLIPKNEIWTIDRHLKAIRDLQRPKQKVLREKLRKQKNKTDDVALKIISV